MAEESEPIPIDPNQHGEPIPMARVILTFNNDSESNGDDEMGTPLFEVEHDPIEADNDSSAQESKSEPNSGKRKAFVLTEEAIKKFQEKTQKEIDANPNKYQNPHALSLEPDFEQFLNEHYSETIENLRCLICCDLVATMYYFPCQHQHKLCGQCYKRMVNYCDNDDCSDPNCHPSSIKCPECRCKIMVPKENREDTLKPDLRFNRLSSDWLKTTKQQYFESKNIDVMKECTALIASASTVQLETEKKERELEKNRKLVITAWDYVSRKAEKTNNKINNVKKIIDEQDEYIEKQVVQFQKTENSLRESLDVLEPLVQQGFASAISNIEKRDLYTLTLEEYLANLGHLEDLMLPEDPELKPQSESESKSESKSESESESESQPEPQEFNIEFSEESNEESRTVTGFNMENTF